MKTASITDVKARFSDYVNASQNGPVVVTRSGKPVVVLLAVTNEDELERLLMAHSPKLQAVLEDSRRSIEAGEGIPSKRFWREVAGEQTKSKRTRQRKKTVRSRVG